MTKSRLFNRILPTLFGVLSLCIAVLYLQESNGFPHRTVPVADALLYANSARTLDVAGIESLATFPLSRLYVLFLYGSQKLASGLDQPTASSFETLEFTYYLQALLFALAAMLSVWFTLRLSRLAACCLGVILVSFGPNLFFVGVCTPVSLSISIGGIALVVLSVNAENQSRWLLGLAGLMMGVLVDFRPHFLAVAVGMSTLLLFVPTSRSRVYRVLDATLFISLTLLPLVILAFVVGSPTTGTALPLRSSVGLNLFIGNHAGAPGTYCKIDEINNEPPEFLVSSRRYAERSVGRALSDYEVNSFWARRAILFWRDQPLEGVALVAKKAQHLLSAKEFPTNYDYPAQRLFSGVLRMGVANFGVILPLTFMALLMTLGGPILARCRWWFGIYGLSLLVFFVSSDHRLPLLIPSAILASIGLASLSDLLFQKKLAQIASCIIIVALTAIVGLSDRTKWYHHQTYHQIGEMALAVGHTELAAKSFMAALREKPDFLPSLQKLGNLEYCRNEYSSAATYYGRALRYDSGSASNWLGYALSVRGLGYTDSAATVIDQRLGIKPSPMFFDSLAAVFCSGKDREVKFNKLRGF